MNLAVIDAADATQLVVILEYLLERPDILAQHDRAKFLFAEYSPPTTSTIFGQTSPGSSTGSRQPD